MRITITLDPALVARARQLTGITTSSALVRAGLNALVAREAARRLAALGGTMHELTPPRRRRPTRH